MLGPGGTTPLSPRNPKIARLRRLSRRRSERVEAQVAVVEGPTLALEALALGLHVELAVVEGNAPILDEVVAALHAVGLVVHAVPDGTLARVLDVATPQPVALVVHVPPARWPLPVSTAVLALDAVADPGNVGTLVRTAEAAGAEAVVLGPGCADPWSPKVVRAAAGSGFRLPPAPVPDLAVELTRMADDGVLVLGTAVDGTPYDELDLHGPVAIVLGNEAHGLSAEVAATVGAHVAIPMAGGIESLNVATAGAVLAFEAARQRRAAGL